MNKTQAQMKELILNVLGGRALHEDQDVDDEAKRAKRFMVLSVNSRDCHEFWIDGFGETIKDVLGVALGIDIEWELEDIYDLLAISLGKSDPKEYTVSIRHGIRAIIDGMPGDTVWEE
jgi:hypothetical protein